MAAEPIKTLELRYPMSQFLIIILYMLYVSLFHTLEFMWIGKI